MDVASEAADARAIPAHHQSIAVVLDLVNPDRAGRWPRHLQPRNHQLRAAAAGSHVRPFIQIDVGNRALYHFAQRDQRVARPER